MTMESTRYRRGRHKIIYAILKNAREPIKKSHLSRATGMTNKTLDSYLPLFLNRDLIEEVPYVWQKGFAKGMKIDKRTSHQYVITDKGEALVRLYDRIYDILGWSESSGGDKQRGKVNGYDS